MSPTVNIPTLDPDLAAGRGGCIDESPDTPWSSSYGTTGQPVVWNPKLAAIAIDASKARHLLGSGVISRKLRRRPSPYAIPACDP